MVGEQAVPCRGWSCSGVFRPRGWFPPAREWDRRAGSWKKAHGKRTPAEAALDRKEGPGEPCYGGVKFPSSSVAGFLPDMLYFTGLRFLVVRLAHADTCAVSSCADGFSLHNSAVVGPP